MKVKARDILIGDTYKVAEAGVVYTMKVVYVEPNPWEKMVRIQSYDTERPRGPYWNDTFQLEQLVEVQRDQSITTDEGAVFTHFTNNEGCIGFRVTASGKPTTYVYLNPSGSVDTGDISDSDVFVYRGTTGDPSIDAPECFINIWDKDE